MTSSDIASYLLIVVIVLLLFAVINLRQLFDKITNKKDNNTVIIVFIIFGLLCIAFSFFAPAFLTEVKIEKPDNTILAPNELGDMFGGTMAPFVGIAGVVFTFLAFYMQKVANDDIKKQFKIQQFENQFYEMLRLHKENVNEIKIKTNTNDILEGRAVFYEMKKELEILITFTIDYNRIPLNSEIFIDAYEMYFWGHNNDIKISNEPLSAANFDNSSYGADLNRLKNKEATKTSFDAEILSTNLKIPFLEGHHSYLGHYYRHLFHTVKFVVNKDFLDYGQKRDYLRTIRAQLSNYEQIMLFYNWLSKYGGAWENTVNHFLTDYKMIHNLWYCEILDNEYFKNELKKLVEKYYSHGYKDDLFEMSDDKLFEDV